MGMLIRMSDLTQEIVRCTFNYNPETGSLTYRERTSIRVKEGQEAGFVTPYGYISVTIQYKRYLAHRIIWLLMTGELPKNDLDHINGNRADNRWSNLREATRAENLQNAKLRSDNTSGVKGVTWDRQMKAWRCQLSKGGKKVMNKLFKELGDAKIAMAAARASHHGEFTNHG